MASPSAAQKSFLVPAYVETGQIIDVDIAHYTVDAVTQFTRKNLPGLSFATPYQHYANGEGIYFMPEVGSLCWICAPSDGGNPFVLAWAPAREQDGSLRSNKLLLNPGDIYLGTRDENFIILRRGGVVQIGGGPLSQRMFIPVTNAIKDFCENYGLHTLGGNLEWTIQREESTTDGRRPALLKIAAKQYADDSDYVAVLQIGSHPDSAANILSLVINASGDAGAAKQINLQFRDDGSANWEFQNSVMWTSHSTIVIRADSTLALSGGNDTTIDGGTVEIESKTGGMQLTSSLDTRIISNLGNTISGSLPTVISPIVETPMLIIGGPGGGGTAGTTGLMKASPSMLTWLASHRHTGVQAGGGVSGVVDTSTPLPTDFIASKAFGV